MPGVRTGNGQPRGGGGNARLEVRSSSRVVTAASGGRLVASGLYAGRQVRAGEVLARFESTAEALALSAAEARLAGFPRVLVVEDGEIVEDGEPAGLLRERTRFRALWEAERQVLRHRWSAAEWRRWQVGAGAIRETAVPGARAA